ncbi:MAG: HK97 gp10 family phage protein [Alkalibacterium sp.]|nr:HK97 gp10 family phage protein [Alkalibacterium sp.]MDN6397675.1 HK97 gp10 family phage protein [Alkalibacterium sp.]MDN6626012.1 HK97 gp10 family phage protein [Pisciglobus halotolerans]MDN6671172.1 HK97 gp10 family phage protein [Staphylococcus equorum]MDN6699170.1 HK97 gp10 family phage protein [Staphylococcus equorum]
MKVTITGTQEIQGTLKKLANMQDVKNTVKLNTSEMQKQAQRLAPVDTGALKRSINMELTSGGYDGRIFSNIEYAPYQELGTRFQPGTPFMRPAGYEQTIKFKRDLLRLMKDKTR